MPQKIKNCFDKNLTFEKLLEAHKRARQHKAYKDEVIRFEMNLENNICNILNNIKNNTYHLGNYYTFRIYEPKERLISALPYKDRVVQQWYVEEFIKPYIIPKFVNCTFACLKDRGTHKAVNEVARQLRIAQRNWGNFWILKCDIKKFFYSIDPNILYHIMEGYIEDKKLLAFTHLIIFDKRSFPISTVGIPIGNFSSQYFANVTLGVLDNYIKRDLKIKYLCRYMDDFVILLKTKKECIEIKEKLEIFLKEKLHLELNDKTRYYPSSMGVNFCGYRIFTTHKLLRLNSKKKIKKNVKHWNTLYEKGYLDIPKTLLSLNSWLGHTSHCNSYKLQTKILNNCEFLYSSRTNSELTEQYLISLIESQNHF